MGVPIIDGSQDTIYTLLFANDQESITQEYEDMEFIVRTSWRSFWNLVLSVLLLPAIFLSTFILFAFAWFCMFLLLFLVHMSISLSRVKLPYIFMVLLPFSYICFSR